MQKHNFIFLLLWNFSFLLFLSLTCGDKHFAPAGQARTEQQQIVQCDIRQTVTEETGSCGIITSGWCLHEHISESSQVNKAHSSHAVFFSPSLSLSIALNMQSALRFPHCSEVKCKNTAIMHIWYLKSLCLMVIFVLNWIYYKMCSDMKHVAAGPLLSDAGAEKGIR